MTYLSTTSGRRLACLSSLFLFKSVCLSGNGAPELFTFNQSTLQGFYFFNEIKVNGELLSSNDWVAAFRCLSWGNDGCDELGPCVGARKWDTSLCTNEVCDVPAQGSDGSDYSNGYMQLGDVPVFLVYIQSQDQYYEPSVIVNDSGEQVLASGVQGWENYGFFMYESMAVEFELAGCMDSEACNYDPSAIADSGLCEYPQENFDCDGSCLVDLDCNEECGGTASLDECGVCGGPGAVAECGCNGIPSGACDCDGNVLDCAGDCGGDATVDDCGVCDNNPENNNQSCADTGGDSGGAWLMDGLPYESAIVSAYPNPFNPSVSIDYQVSAPQKVSIYIVDTRGAEVERIEAGYQAPGRYQAMWHPGKTVPSGMYLLVLEGEDELHSKSVTFIK